MLRRWAVYSVGLLGNRGTGCTFTGKVWAADIFSAESEARRIYGKGFWVAYVYG